MGLPSGPEATPDQAAGGTGMSGGGVNDDEPAGEAAPGLSGPGAADPSGPGTENPAVDGESPELVRERLSRELADLEYYRTSEVEARLEGARRLEREAFAAGAVDLQYRAQLVQGDMLLRVGQPTAAAALLAEVNRWAREHGPQSLLSRSHLVLSSALESIGDLTTALDHATRALELIEPQAPPRTRAHLLLRLADVHALCGTWNAARERYQQAGEIFEDIADEDGQLNLLNNLAFTELRAGNLPEAAGIAERMVALATDSGLTLNPAAMDTLARIQVAAGELDAAEETLNRAIERLEAMGDIEATTPADLMLTLVEVQRQRGRLAEAQATIERCRAVCAIRSLSGIDVQLLREESELHAAAGRFEQAYEMHKLFHDEWVRMSFAERETARRARMELFATVEARQEAQRMWRQARTDPLTGLRNRRWVEEELPGLMREVGPGSPLAVAIVDADHFKPINESVSREVGDQVIRTLAGLLDATVRGQGQAQGRGHRPGPGEDRAFVARLGAEEFLVVLPGRDGVQASALLEEMRSAVDRYRWRPLTGDLRVTVSIGGAAARPSDLQADLLARADRNLFQAKVEGRNRVVFDR